MSSSIGFVVKYIIMCSGLLSSIEFKLEVRLYEDFECEQSFIWKLSELLFELIESGWWFWMSWLDIICVDVMVLML